MAKSKILDKLKLRRTRPADIEGDPVQVKVYSEKQLKEIKDKLAGFKEDSEYAAFMADQFLDESGENIFTPEDLLSEDIPDVAYKELAAIFWQVNYGIYKKKQ